MRSSRELKRDGKVKFCADLPREIKTVNLKEVLKVTALILLCKARYM